MILSIYKWLGYYIGILTYCIFCAYTNNTENVFLIMDLVARSSGKGITSLLLVQLGLQWVNQDFYYFNIISDVSMLMGLPPI